MDITKFTAKELKLYAKGVYLESKKYPVKMKRLEMEDLPTASAKPGPNKMVEVWRSNRFLCQVFTVNDDVVRLSICKTQVDIIKKRWVDGITWDELQQVKKEVGMRDLDAIEIYPAENRIVNVANMRHLWVYRKPHPLAWGNQPLPGKEK